MPITVQHKKESLGIAYVRAVIAKAGYNIAGKTDFDYGIDGTIRSVINREGRYISTGIGLDFQLKSSCDVSFQNGNLIYDLQAKNYNDLISPSLMFPRILILFVLPEIEEDWLAISTEYMTMKKCAWWYSLAGLPEVANRNSKRISIPLTQVFSPEALTDIMDRIQGGDTL